MPSPLLSRIRWKPALFEGIGPLGRRDFWRNIAAGVSLAAMNIPQAMGYAKIAGMPVITGLYTLLLPLIAFAALGSSRYLVVAADSATAAILAGGLAGLAAVGTPQYAGLAGLVALLTAAFLLLARLFKLGFLADFLSRTVLIGFLTGVGIQVGIAVLGGMLKLETHTSNPLGQLAQIVAHLPESNVPTALLSLGLVVSVLVLHRFLPRFPGALMAVIATVAASAVFGFERFGIALIGPVAGGLPSLALPPIDASLLRDLLPVAASCFVMIVAQSAVTARAYAARHHQPHQENHDLVGLAAANTAAACTGAFVVNGSPTQTAMVENSGGNSQLAHLATAACVALVLLFLTGPLQYLPVCALSAIVFTIALRLIDLKGLNDLRTKSPREWMLALFTAAAVVFFGVEHGIVLALILSLLQHVRHSYEPSTSLELPTPDGRWLMRPTDQPQLAQPGLIVYWFGSDLFYANADLFAAEVRRLAASAGGPVRWFVIDSGAITSMDYTAGLVLKELDKDLAKLGIDLVFVHLSEGFRVDLERQQLVPLIGREHLFQTLRDCLAAYAALPPRAGK